MKRRNRGQVLVLVALAIFVLLGFAALGIDVGFMYSVRHELQRSADAGALAGASAIREFGRDCNEATLNTNGRTTKAEAELRAIDYATRDDVAKFRLNTVAGDIVTAICPDNVTNNPMRVRVDVQRTVPLFFARAIGWDTAPISAFAVAEAFPVSERVECVVPWGIPAPWTENTGSPETFDLGDTVNWPAKETDCINMPVTTWTAHDNGPRSPRDQYLCQGSLQTLKIGVPQEKIDPGNFFGMDLSNLVGPGGCPGKNDNPGASFYYWMITHSCDCDLKVGVGDELPIDTKPGNMVQNTIEAVAPESYYLPKKDSYLPSGWKNDPDSLMNRDDSTWVAGADGGAPSTGNNSPRIVRIPIYDPRTDIKGRTTFTPLGFVGFWIQDVVYKTETIDGKTKDLGTVVGRFVTVGGWGAGSGGGAGNAGTPVLNIRLVE